MTYIWFVCLLVGFLVPILSLILDIFDSIFEFELNFDLDIDFDFFPTSIKSLCIGLFMYGSIALIVNYASHSIKLSNIIGGILGYISAVIVQNILRYLKHNESYANDRSIVLFSEGIVINKIAKNGFGVIQINIPNDSIQTYTAKSKNGESIEQGTNVKVVEIVENGILVVELV